MNFPEIRFSMNWSEENQRYEAIAIDHNNRLIAYTTTKHGHDKDALIEDLETIWNCRLVKVGEI